jgi:UrcA family protein
MNTNTSAKSLLRLIGTAALGALSLSFTVVSYAYDSPGEHTVTVEFVSASASTSQGASALYRRIRGAAENVCSVLDHGDLSSKRPFRACVRMTIEDAVRKVNRQALSAAYNADYPPAPTGRLLATQLQ